MYHGRNVLGSQELNHLKFRQGFSDPEDSMYRMYEITFISDRRKYMFINRKLVSQSLSKLNVGQIF